MVFQTVEGGKSLASPIALACRYDHQCLEVFLNCAKMRMHTGINATVHLARCLDRICHGRASGHSSSTAKNSVLSYESASPDGIHQFRRGRAGLVCNPRIVLA